MVFDPTMGGDATQPQGDQPTTAAPEQKEEGAAPAAPEAGDQPAA